MKKKNNNEKKENNINKYINKLLYNYDVKLCILLRNNETTK